MLLIHLIILFLIHLLSAVELPAYLTPHKVSNTMPTAELSTLAIDASPFFDISSSPYIVTDIKKPLPNIPSEYEHAQDPFFGLRDIAELCTSYLVKSFGCSEESDTSRFLRQPCLPIFISKLVYRTDVPNSVVSATLILLQRFHAHLPANFPGFSGHRLFLAAFIIAAQEFCECDIGSVSEAKTRSARYWSELSQFPERDIDDIHGQLFDELEGNVTVYPSYGVSLEKMRDRTVKVNLDAQWAVSDDPGNRSSLDDLSLASSGDSRGWSSPSTPESVAPSKSTRSVRKKIASIFKTKRS